MAKPHAVPVAPGQRVISLDSLDEINKLLGQASAICGLATTWEAGECAFEDVANAMRSVRDQLRRIDDLVNAK